MAVVSAAQQSPVHAADSNSKLTGEFIISFPTVDFLTQSNTIIKKYTIFFLGKDMV